MTDTLSREIETINNFNNKYVSSPIGNINTVELQLLKIFEDEVNSENPVILDFIPLTLEEIFISEMEEKGYDFSKLDI